MTDRITVLLRDSKGSAIGTGNLPTAALDRGPVYVSIPQWPGSAEYFVIELRREGEPVQIDGAAADWDVPAEPIDLGPAVPHIPIPPFVSDPLVRLAGAEVADQLARPEHPELAAELAAAAGDVVTFSVHCPDGSTVILRDEAGARTVGEIATELAERLRLSKRARASDPADNWTLGAQGREPYDPGRSLTPAADGLTFALVRTPLSVQTGQ